MDTATLGNLELDRDRYEVRIGGERVELTYTQFALLDTLVARAGRVVPQEELVGAVWGAATPNMAGRLRVQMSRLRKKLEGSRPWAIRTVQRRGYALADLSEGAADGRSGRMGRLAFGR
jgi:two-component system OmpR family response regulator